MSVYRLDITREHCPMTFVKTKLELEKLGPGDRLEVLLSEGEPLENVPKASAEQGYKVIGTSEAGKGIYRVVLEK